MLDQLKAYRKIEYPINSKITVRQPTLDEVCEYGEREYLGLVHTLCATPSDRKVDIWDSLHVYWDTVDEYELFISLFRALKGIDISIVLPGIVVDDFVPMIHTQTKQIVLRNSDGVVIDRAIHSILTDYLRSVHKLTKNVDFGCNDYTKDIMIEDDRDEREMLGRKEYRSNLLPLISTMTNDEGFKYRYDDIWGLPIGVFMDAVVRVSHRRNYDQLMTGIYTGNIDVKKINKKELNLFGELK